MTLLIVTHEERVSEAARRVLRIRDGVIVDEASYHEKRLAEA